jgi:hypothetical protein
MSQFGVSVARAIRSACVISPILMCAFALSSPLQAQLTITGYNGASVAVFPNGSWSLTIPGPRWTFSGGLGTNAVAAHIVKGEDALGSFEEIAFDYSINVSSRTAAIRLYDSRPAVLFSVTWNNASANSSPFPVINSYPASLSHLTFNGMFSPADFNDLMPDSPWAFFDKAGNTFILSPAQNFMTATTARNGDGSIATGISGKIGILPAGFSHKTMLAYGTGINRTFENWGNALTTLRGKKRSTNDSEALLKSISYWTDNGATYYYNPGGPSYSDTLATVKKEFDAKGIRLGSLQLDSWWYPKGPDDSWSSHSGIWTYNAAPGLFTPDLATFQAGLKTPLVTHARWIDANSPYRTQYTMSGDAITDPKYWETIGDYLKSSGVITYEQDWLGQGAATAFNLTDPDAFLGNMAASMAKRGITIQYCMATPTHFLQSTNYSNVTTIRTSQDRFRREVWSDFFYSSRFASSIGLWPFTDVFMSTETSNLILATLSAGPVGVGDAMGDLSKANLLKSVRSDGVIVKPDVPATPEDSVYQSDALGLDAPMVASAYTDFGGGLRTYYIFAFIRGVNRTVTIAPAAYGITGSAYLYDALNDSGRLIDPQAKVTFDLTDDTGYFVLSPVGSSGIAMLGDKDQFVTLGKKRIPALVDDGQTDIKVSFAAGEKSRTIFGYSAHPVDVSMIAGTYGGLLWDASTQIFTVNVHPVAGKAHLRFRPEGTPAKSGGCLLGCAGGTPLPGPTQSQ